jgi:uncharacterized OB-fold protein
VKHQLVLDYTVPVGDLAPYFEALHAGVALASKCNSCGAVAFPARTRCGVCVGSEMTWKELDGTAQIMFRTNTPSESFALVKFAGADTSSTVRLRNPEITTPSGTLVAPDGDRPALWLELDTQRGGHDESR